MATGFHGFHVIVGTIFLIVCLIRAYKGDFTPQAAFRLRGGCLVLAFRRRRVAVPVRLDLRLGRLGRAARAGDAERRRRSRSPLAAALRGPLPALRARTLFAGWVRLRADSCRGCGLDFDSFNVGDGPAAFLILIVGAIVVVGALVARRRVRAAVVGAPRLDPGRGWPDDRRPAARQGVAARAGISAPRARRADRRMIRRLPLIPTIVVAAAVAAMIGLGIWQLQRAQWKEGLLAQYAAAEKLPPIALPTAPLDDDQLPLFRHATGVCLRPSASARSPARTAAGEPGYAHIVDCATGAEGPGMSVEVGWSKNPNAERRLARRAGQRDHRARPRRRGCGWSRRAPPPGLEPSAPPSTASRSPTTTACYAVAVVRCSPASR